MGSSTSLAGVCLLLLVATSVDRALAVEDRASTASLTASVQVLMPDGSPAKGAMVQSLRMFEPRPITVSANDEGKVQLRDAFLGGVRIAAASADGRYQATLTISETDARTALARPQTITLKPAVPHQVTVTADGEPVEGASVVLTAGVCLRTAITANNGVVTLWRPEAEEVSAAVAWHPELGTDGRRFRNSKAATSAGSQIEMSLRAIEPHLIRVIDIDRNPVVGQELNVNMLVGDQWIRSGLCRGTDAVTDGNGEVRFGWFPADDLRTVDVRLTGQRWIVDQTDGESIDEGLTTVTIRKKRRVAGRVEFPDGVDARGLMITGSGSGPRNLGDLVRVRTRSDGSFDLHVASGYGYVMGVTDSVWTSDIWSGIIIAGEGQPPREIVMRASTGTPLNIRVTRGDPAQAVEAASLNVSRKGRVEMTEESGKTKVAGGSVRSSLRSDANGIRSTVVGPGEVRVRVRSGDWSEEKTLQISHGEPASVHFHRDWVGSRVLTAMPSLEDGRYKPSGNAVVTAWSKRKTYAAWIHQPTIDDDGIVSVAFDQDEIVVLLLDRQQHVSGFAEAGRGVAHIKLPMLPNASYSGRLVDRFDDSPLADRTVRIKTDSSYLDVVEPQQTGSEGEFSFTDLPAGVPLRLVVVDEKGRPEYTLFGSDLLFDSGEIRTGDIARASLMDGNSSAARRPKEIRAIAERTALAAADARVMRMGTLVMIQGGPSKSVKHVARRLASSNTVAEISRFLVVTVTHEQLTEESALLQQLNWPLPADGEIALICSSDGREAIASCRVDCTTVESAIEQGSEFVRANAPQATGRTNQIPAGSSRRYRERSQCLGHHRRPALRTMLPAGTLG